MKRNLIVLTVFLLFFLVTSNIKAQFTVSAELRPRFEYLNGFKQLADTAKDPAFVISQRTRLKVNYLSERFSAGITMQDVRIWGDESLISSTGVYGDTASLELSEGWLQIKISNSINLKAGRQYWIYDDERLLATRNWNQNSITYDGLLFMIEKEKWHLHLGGSWNNSIALVFDEPYTSKRMKTLNFMHFYNKVSEAFNYSLMATASGYMKDGSKSVIYLRGSYGLFLRYTKDIYGLETSLYHQNGTNTKGKDVDAWFFSARASVKPGKFGLTGGIDYISGQDQSNNDGSYQAKDHLFDILYGARHRYYGYMDYFSNVPKSTKNGGLIDLIAKLEWKPFSKHTFNLDYHYFSLAAKILDPNDENKIMPRKLSNEIDFVYKFKFSDDIILEAGYSVMLPYETLMSIQGLNENSATFSNWAYMMITAKPVFFKQK